MALLLLALLFSSTFVHAQASAGGSSPATKPVTITVFAFSRDKHAIADVEKNDLMILDNKRPVTSISSLEKASTVPLRIGLVIDNSNSQRKSGLYQPAIQAATNVLKQILNGPDDKVVVVKTSFVPWASELMSRAQFASYKTDVSPQGGTALYDAVALACVKLQTDQKPPTRRALILLSDGDDNISHITREGAVATAIKDGVVIFSVGTLDDSSARYAHGASGDSTLEHLADETGGEAFVELNRKSMERSFSTIEEAINNMYFVTFEAADSSEKGCHAVELKTSAKGKVRLRAPKSFCVQ